MEFANIVKAYLEIGFLGLCAVAVIWTFFHLMYKNKNKEGDDAKKLEDKDNYILKTSENLSNKLDKLMEIVQNQNRDFLEKQAQYIEAEQQRNEQLINQIINGVTSHVPSPEENARLSDISNQIDELLSKMLNETSACRTALVQYHNGGKGVNRQSFLKMSMSNEQVQLGVKPFMGEFKDQFRSVLSYFTKELNDVGYCYITDINDIQNEDTSMYEFMSNRNVVSMFGYAIKSKEDEVIGFILIEYMTDMKVDINTIDRCFKEHHKVFETLLTL